MVADVGVFAGEFFQISLFSGLGCTELGLKLVLPIHTVAYCESDAKVRERLVARIADGVLDDAPIWDDVRTFPGELFAGRGVWMVSGGFPCQDISLAGPGGGLEGARSGLFFDLVRIVRVVRPRFVLLENVAALLARGRGMGGVLAALAAIGYDAVWTCLQAWEVGAPIKKRDRIFVLAYANDRQCEGAQGALRAGGASADGGCCEVAGSAGCRCKVDEELNGEAEEGSADGVASGGHADGCADEGGAVGIAAGGGWEGVRAEGGEGAEVAVDEGVSDGSGGRAELWPRGQGVEQHAWEPPRTVVSGVGRGADGSADRVVRVGAIGNGIVPQQLAVAVVGLFEELVGR